jgi:hypothetical protein
LHQSGLVEWVAAVFALAQSRRWQRLADDFGTGERCSDGFDCDMVFVVDRQAAEHADDRRSGCCVGSHLGVLQDHLENVHNVDCPHWG